MVSRDVASFELWYREVHARLVTVVTAAVGDADVGRDAVDDALVRAFERWAKVSQMVSPTGWAYRVALYRAYRHVRRRRIEARLLGERRVTSVAGPTGELWLLVADLPSRQREALLLRHVGDLTEQEIANVMHVARGTVSSMLRSAHRRLYTQIRDDDLVDEELHHD